MFDAIANFDSLPAAPQVDFTYSHSGQSRFRRKSHSDWQRCQENDHIHEAGVIRDEYTGPVQCSGLVHPDFHGGHAFCMWHPDHRGVAYFLLQLQELLRF